MRIRKIALSATIVALACSTVAMVVGTVEAPIRRAAEITAPSYNGWTSGNFWGGGYVQGVVLCPSDPNRCYAYIDMAGLYRSDDRGASWRMLHGAFPNGVSFGVRGVAVDPRDADRIVAFLDGGIGGGTGWILSSTDGGASFKIVARATADNGKARNTGFILDRNPANPDELVVGDFGGVLKSVDNGATWRKVWSKKISPTDLRYDRRTTMRLFMCCPHLTRWGTRGGAVRTDFEKGFYVSEDGGASWRIASAESPQEIVQSRSNPDELYGIFNSETVKRSTDNGATWVDCSKGLPKTGIDWHDNMCNVNIFAGIQAGRDFVVVCNTFGGFYRLEKDSDVWREVKIETVDPNGYIGAEHFVKHVFKNCASITIDPKDENHWYTTDFYNVMQTFDGGRNWIATSAGMSQVVMKGGFVLPGTTNVVVSMMDHLWYVTKDGGKTYAEYPHPVGYETMYFQSAPSDPNTIYASGPRGGSVIVTRDGGKSWTRAKARGLPPNKWMVRGTPGAHHFIPASTAVDPRRSNVVYVGVAPGGGAANTEVDKVGVYVSHDAGDTWTRMSEGLPTPHGKGDKGFFENTNVLGHELAVTRKGTPVAMSVVYNLVCRFDAAERTWVTVRSDPSRPWGLCDLQQDPYADRLWLTAKNDGLWHSDDDGRTWRKFVAFPGASAGRMNFDRARPGRFTVCSRKALWLTEDGGQTWWCYDFDLKMPGRGLNSLAILNGDNIIYTTQESGVFYHNIVRDENGNPKGGVKSIRMSKTQGHLPK